jgi:putative DNA primase/helicase
MRPDRASLNDAPEQSGLQLNGASGQTRRLFQSDDIFAREIRSAISGRIARAGGNEERLAALEWEALQLHTLVAAGALNRRIAGDALYEAAISNGLLAIFGADTVQHICANGLNGRTSGLKITPQSLIPIGASDANSSSLIYRCAADIVPEAIQWLWPGRIAVGKQTLIAGEPGLGKSQIAISAVAAVTRGGYWPCGEGKAPSGKAIFLCAEDDPGDTIVPRLMAVNADLRKVGFITAVRVGCTGGLRSFNLQADLALLEAQIVQLGDVRIVVIDPISSYMGKIDSHKNADVRSVLELVGEMAARLRVAVLSITHFSKGSGEKAINRFIGSIAFIAAARSAFAVVQDPDDELRRLFMPVKNNLSPLGNGLAFRLEQHIVADKIVASCISWDSEPVTGTADSILAASNEIGTQTSTKADAIEFLQNLLANGPMTSKGIREQADAAGYSWATVKRAKKYARIEHYREGGAAAAGYWLWRLPNKSISLTSSWKAYLAHVPNVSQLADIEPVKSGGCP